MLNARICLPSSNFCFAVFHNGLFAGQPSVFCRYSFTAQPCGRLLAATYGEGAPGPAVDAGCCCAHTPIARTDAPISTTRAGCRSVIRTSRNVSFEGGQYGTKFLGFQLTAFTSAAWRSGAPAAVCGAQ